MATQIYSSSGQNSVNRSVAMLLALTSAVVLSPLYINRKTESSRFSSRYSYETRWSSGFVLPMVLGGLIVAIRAVSSTSSSSSSSSSFSSSSSSAQQGARGPTFPSLDSSFVLRIGSSSWGLAGVLVLLLTVLSWQGSVQEFFWR